MDELQKLINTITDIRDGISKLLPEATERIVELIKYRIVNEKLSNDAGWRPHYKTNWLKRKERAGHYPQLLMMTRAFVNSIRMIKDGSNKTVLGVDDPAIQKYMITHELGIKPQDERSVFRKSLELYGDEFLEMIADELSRKLIIKFKKM